MRINNRTSFPHPVLSEMNDDYLEGEFSVGIDVQESRKVGSVQINYEINITELSIKKLIDSGMAHVGMFIVCNRTYYNEYHRLNDTKGEIVFNVGELRNRTVFRPLVCVDKSISVFNSPNLHEEFYGINWGFKPADILAIGSELVIEVGLDKLAPMETIFELAISEDIPEGETRVDLGHEKIRIAASKKTCSRIDVLRGSSVGKLALLNGVYLPVVMETLSALSNQDEDFSQRSWFSVFSAQCRHRGVDLAKPNLLEDAQKLLMSPLGSLINSKEYDL